MPQTAGSSALKSGERFTVEQRNSWPENERWELIDGQAYGMSPAPRVPHQMLVLCFARKLAEFLDGKPCQALIAPVDVFLPDDDDGAQSVVQPDVLVVCHPEIIKDDGVHGAPDFIAEILSDSTAYKDLTQKKALYERAGVREYWILNPDSGSTLVYVLENGRYLPARELLRGNPVLSSALDGFSFTVA